MSRRPLWLSLSLALPLVALACGGRESPQPKVELDESDQGARASQGRERGGPVEINGVELDTSKLARAQIGAKGPRGKRGRGKPARLASCAAPRGSWYLHLSDVHLGTTVTSQDPSGDTSAPLWEATKAALRERIASANPPRFILYTGDLPDHAPDHGDPHTTNIEAVLTDLKALAGSIPLIYLPGNNDSLDWDYASFTSAAGQTPLTAAGWPGPTLNTPSRGDAAQGYASASPVPGLRVVALNTVMFSASYPCSHQPKDSAGACSDSQTKEVTAQLDWLEAELKAAGEAKDKVLLAMHIPPGVDAYSSPKTMWKDSSWQDRFLQLIDQSPATIVGLSFGHTHLDELRRLYDASGELELVALSAPGITPGHGNNPGFKAVWYDEDFMIQDALTWYASASGPEAGDFEYGPNNCYRYRDVFDCGQQDLKTCLGAKDVCALNARMDQIYKVKRGVFEAGAPGYYATAPGIEVRPGDAAPASCPD